MKTHVKNYLNHFGYTESDFIACELCGMGAVDIHHVEPRSKFGSKRKQEQDSVTNLIALCRICHEFAHSQNWRVFKRKIKEVIKNRK